MLEVVDCDMYFETERVLFNIYVYDGITFRIITHFKVEKN